MTIETRHHLRILLTFQVHIRYRHRIFQANAGNLSSDGMLLQTAALTVPTGTLIDLEFQLGNRQWMVVGLVAWQSPGRMGIVFRNPQTTLSQLAGNITGMQLQQRQDIPLIQPPVSNKRSNTTPVRRP